MSSFFIKLAAIIKFFLLCHALFIGIICYAQNENRIAMRQQINKTTIGENDFSYTFYYDHSNRIINDYIQRVDSIAQAAGISGPFCRAYSKIMENIDYQIQSMDSAAILFIKKFEVTFADYFLKAWIDDKNGNMPATSEWKCLFSRPPARPWQLILLGVNVHVNIDFWQALTDNFSEYEIRQHKKELLACQASVAKEYYRFFDTWMTENRYLRFVNSFTKGLTKKLGERIIYKWRRRNINLAIMFYHDPEKFKRRWTLIKKKKKKIDEVILRQKKICCS